MFIREATHIGRAALENPAEVEILLAWALQSSREFLIAHPEFEILSEHAARFKNALSLRSSGKPIAYIIGRKEFFGLNFFVDERVLIPRPETEMLVEEALNQAKRRLPCAEDSALTFVDVGTGSGCIAIALAIHLPNAEVIALDISPQALEVAKRNAEQNQAGKRMRFIQSDLLHAVRREKMDIVVANLPYIGSEDNDLISREVRDHEPSAALFGGPDGLELYERLFQQLAELLKKPRCLIAEIGFLQRDRLEELAKKFFPDARFQFRKDLAELDRMAVIEFL